MNQDINALLTAAFGLTVDIMKAHKLNKGLPGYVDTVVNDAAVISSLKLVVTNIQNLPTDFSNMKFNDYMELLPTILTGLQQISTAAKA